MSLHPAADVPLLVASPNSQSERRVTPSWSLAHLKTRLEPVTGIPAACQKLTLRIGSQAPVALEAANEDQTALSSFPLQPYAEIYVSPPVSLHRLRLLPRPRGRRHGSRVSRWPSARIDLLGLSRV